MPEGYIIANRVSGSGERKEYKYRVYSVNKSKCECSYNHNDTSELQFYKDAFITGMNGIVVGTTYEYDFRQ